LKGVASDAEAEQLVLLLRRHGFRILAMALEAVELISQRGFARRRNLRAALLKIGARQRPDLAGGKTD